MATNLYGWNYPTSVGNRYATAPKIKSPYEDTLAGLQNWRGRVSAGGLDYGGATVRDAGLAQRNLDAQLGAIDQQIAGAQNQNADWWNQVDMASPAAAKFGEQRYSDYPGTTKGQLATRLAPTLENWNPTDIAKTIEQADREAAARRSGAYSEEEARQRAILGPGGYEDKGRQALGAWGQTSERLTDAMEKATQDAIGGTRGAIEGYNKWAQGIQDTWIPEQAAKIYQQGMVSTNLGGLRGPTPLTNESTRRTGGWYDYVTDKMRPLLERAIGLQQRGQELQLGLPGQVYGYETAVPRWEAGQATQQYGYETDLLQRAHAVSNQAGDAVLKTVLAKIEQDYPDPAIQAKVLTTILNQGGALSEHLLPLLGESQWWIPGQGLVQPEPSYLNVGQQSPTRYEQPQQGQPQQGQPQKSRYPLYPAGPTQPYVWPQQDTTWLQQQYNKPWGGYEGGGSRYPSSGAVTTGGPSEYYADWETPLQTGGY